MYQPKRRNSNNMNSQEQESSNQFTYVQSTFSASPQAKKAKQQTNTPVNETSTAPSEIVQSASSTVRQQQETVRHEVTKQTNSPEIYTSTQSQENVVPEKSKKKKKKSKTKKVEQEAPVKEGEQNPPQTTIAALPTAEIEQQQGVLDNIQIIDERLSRIRQGVQKYEQTADRVIALYPQLRYSDNDSNDKTLKDQEISRIFLNIKKMITNEEDLKEQGQNIKRQATTIQLIKAKLSELKIQENNNEKVNKTNIFLEKKLTEFKEDTDFFFRLCNFFIEQAKEVLRPLDHTINTYNIGRDFFINTPTQQQLKLPPKSSKKRFVEYYDFAFLRLNKLSQNVTQHLEDATTLNLLNEIEINQISNEINNWIDTYKSNKKKLIQFKNKQNDEEEKFRNFIDDYNLISGEMIRTQKQIDDLTIQIKRTDVRDQEKKLKTEYQKLIKTIDNYRTEQIAKYKTYKSQIEEDIVQWDKAYKEMLIKVHRTEEMLEYRFKTIVNQLQIKILETSNSQVKESENLREDDPFSPSQEHSSLIEEIPEVILSKIQDLHIDFPESEQLFQVAGKSKKGKTISGTGYKRSIPVVQYKEGKWQESGEYKVNDIGFFRIAQNTKLVRVEFDPQMKMEKREQLYAKPFFELNQTIYRFDLLNSGNRDYAWAIETDKDNLSTIIHPFDEAVAYTRQALLTTPLAVNTGSKIKGTAVKDKTPFTLKNGIELMVSDGFGFIKASLADSLISKIKSQRQSASTPSLQRPALPNTQMLQWLPQNNKLIFELVENGINSINQLRGIKQLSQKSASTDRDLPKNAASVPDMQIEKLYRAVTTGNFAVRVGTAMPVPGEQVVLPPSILPNHTEVALHRSPADTMNWTTGSVASEDLCSEYIGNMYGLQYRWAGNELGHQSEPFVFYRGVLGRIPDEEWDSKYPGDIVVCTEDRKVDKGWKKAADIDQAKQTETQFMIKGDLAVSKLLDPGSIIGVPPQMMKNLSGDYDGDEVHILAKSDSPVLFHQIQLQEPKKIPNPKLEKDRRFPQLSVSSPATQDISTLFSNRFAIPEQQTETLENPAARSLSERLLDITIGNQLVGTWATVADLLSTVNPLRLEREFPEDIGELIVQKPLQNQQELWQYIGLGIKAGTDLAKTNLERTEFLGRKLTAKELLKEGKTIRDFLVYKKGLKSPHKRRNQKSIVDDITQGKRLSVIYNEEQGELNVRSGHYGNLFEIMLAMDLHLESYRTSQDFTFKGNLTPTQLERATRSIEKVRKRKSEISAQDVFILELYEILGNLKQILQSNKENKHARENGSLWMLLVIKELQPAKLRQELYAQSSPTPAADLQSRYDNLLNQIQELWHQFTSSNVTTEGDGYNIPSYEWFYDDNDPRIMAGINNQIIYGGIIQNPDQYGGRNVDFRLTNSVSLYHIHFNGAEGKRVNAVRFKLDSNQEGDNILVFSDNKNGATAPRERLKSLSSWCQNNGYPNHSLLLSNLLNAIPEQTSATQPHNTVIPIRGDGNCFFRAVAEGLERQFSKTSYDHCQLRQLGVKYMRDNPDSFEPYITPRLSEIRHHPQFQDVYTFDQYLSKLAEDGIWSGYYEASALTFVLGKKINLMFSENDQPEPDSINLIFVNDNHFNLILPVSAQAASSSTASRVVEGYGEQGA